MECVEIVAVTLPRLFLLVGRCLAPNASLMTCMLPHPSLKRAVACTTRISTLRYHLRLRMCHSIVWIPVRLFYLFFKPSRLNTLGTTRSTITSLPVVLLSLLLRHFLGITISNRTSSSSNFPPKHQCKQAHRHQGAEGSTVRIIRTLRKPT
jgi:hypothetical protein